MPADRAWRIVSGGAAPVPAVEPVGAVAASGENARRGLDHLSPRGADAVLPDRQSRCEPTDRRPRGHLLSLRPKHHEDCAMKIFAGIVLGCLLALNAHAVEIGMPAKEAQARVESGAGDFLFVDVRDPVE